MLKALALALVAAGSFACGGELREVRAAAPERTACEVPPPTPSPPREAVDTEPEREMRFVAVREDEPDAGLSYDILESPGPRW
jgi:hypothetical protein